MQDHASKRVCLHGGATLRLSSLLTWQSSTQQLKLFVAVHRGCMVIRLATKKNLIPSHNRSGCAVVFRDVYMVTEFGVGTIQKKSHLVHFVQ